MTTTMLRDVSDYAEREGIFIFKPIYQLESTACSCSDVDALVIDFDHAKDELTRLLELPDKPKSCDALKIKADQNQLIFVEMKGFRQMENRFLAVQPRPDHEELVERQVTRFDFPKKINDSIWLWERIVERSGCEPLDSEIRFVILTDIELLDDLNAETFLDFTIQYLADETTPIDQIAQMKMQEMLEQGHPVSIKEKPHLISCVQINEFLNS